VDRRSHPEYYSVSTLFPHWVMIAPLAAASIARRSVQSIRLPVRQREVLLSIFTVRILLWGCSMLPLGVMGDGCRRGYPPPYQSNNTPRHSRTQKCSDINNDGQIATVWCIYLCCPPDRYCRFTDKGTHDREYFGYRHRHRVYQLQRLLGSELRRVPA